MLILNVGVHFGQFRKLGVMCNEICLRRKIKVDDKSRWRPRQSAVSEQLTMARVVSKYSETAHAIATPSSLLVARPSSSRRNRDLSGVEPLTWLSIVELQMNAVSFISNKNVEMLCSWSSDVPIRVQIWSRIGSSASSAGT